MSMPSWQIRDRAFVWDKRTYLMGVINVTPDSFSDGGLFNSAGGALAHADRLIPYADILDIGGESTRPGAEAVSTSDEIDRVLPAIEAIRSKYPDIPISVDTTKAAVAEAAIQVGADIINDVSAGTLDVNMLPLAARCRVPIILMHMQGEPRTMQMNPHYQDVVVEVRQYLAARISQAIAAGVPPHLIAIDPGIGFGKTLEHNLELLRHLSELQQLDCPILVGVSRKSFIGKLCNQPDPTGRLWGTTAACTVAIAGGTNVLRVHDPREIRDICRVSDAIYRRI
ncbi:dihydropteroate synthase [Pseudanabaena sp. PCC 6802]|uniref:dihydropteroate synthase n=1 Tax=Pseudanabaena sp. PCC 6802 TaxID=118173 RepID=UPI000349CEDA|nr:dihydropteroate synthase [Pseudanabaena sp. PCC 6802]